VSAGAERRSCAIVRAEESPGLDCDLQLDLAKLSIQGTHEETAMKTDSQLKTDVTRELAWDIHIDETAIGVSAHHGVVTLTGIVDSWSAKHAAEEAAHRVAGLLDVANEIEIRPSWNQTRCDADIAGTVRDALVWNRFVPDRQIHSTVADQGTVTLTGTVRTLAQREEAERVVRDLAGVHGVVNQIAIEGPTVAEGALHDTITQALERHVAREADRITVRVEGDTVVLAGGVASWREHRAVLGAAKGTPGVRRIDDQLQIQG
jgi:osmotically-inducible protein OsmY